MKGLLFSIIVCGLWGGSVLAGPGEKGRPAVIPRFESADRMVNYGLRWRTIKI